MIAGRSPKRPPSAKSKPGRRMRMRPTWVFLFPLLAFGCAGPVSNRTPATARSARQCFWASEVTSFGDAGPKRVIANIYNQEKWELTLASGCSNANWAMRIGIVSRGSQEICTDRPAELLMPLPTGGTQRCLVSSIRKITSAEAAGSKGRPR